jgi:hypothetical protein
LIFLAMRLSSIGHLHRMPMASVVDLGSYRQNTRRSKALEDFVFMCLIGSKRVECRANSSQKSLEALDHDLDG